MPRELDLYRRGAAVTNNPTNTISPKSIAGIVAQQPPNLAEIAEEAAEDVVTNLLTIIDDVTGLDLVAWWQETTTTLANYQSALQQSWLNFQQLINGIVGEVDSDVSALVTALSDTSTNATTAIDNWTTVFTDLGLSPSTATEFGTWLGILQSSLNDIFASFSTGGTLTEFQTGVSNLLGLFGLTSSSIGGATVVDTVWTDVINDIINPLNAIETTAANIIGDIEQSAISGLTDVWDWLTGTTTPTSTTQVLSTAVQSALGGDRKSVV